jgi:enoyl-CoA hydratase/carnithine racemase
MPGLGGTQRLAQIVGDKKAMRYILSGESIPASEAYKLNIADKVSSENFNE